jgi:hypothetical protein
MSSSARKRKADDALTFSADVLECSVCCERFDATTRAPRILECGHHFGRFFLSELAVQKLHVWSLCPVQYRPDPGYNS